MSLLEGDAPAVPELAYAAARVTRLLGGTVERNVLEAWLLKEKEASEGRNAVAGRNRVEKSVNAAVFLSLLEERGSTLMAMTRRPPDDYTSFMDFVHDRLVSAMVPTHRALLFAYSTAVAYSNAAGAPDAASRLSEVEFVDLVHDKSNAHLGVAYNPTKHNAWRRWMCAAGLAWTSPKVSGFTGMGVEIDPTLRIARDLPDAWKHLGVAPGEAAPARGLLDWISQRFPYLEGGSIYRDVAGDPEPTRVGVVLSAALRGLQRRGTLTLLTPKDAPGAVTFPAFGLEPTLQVALVQRPEAP